MKTLTWNPVSLPKGITYKMIEEAECGNTSVKNKITKQLKANGYTQSKINKFLKDNLIP